jgi:hypothetical protein
MTKLCSKHVWLPVLLFVYVNLGIKRLVRVCRLFHKSQCSTETESQETLGKMRFRPSTQITSLLEFSKNFPIISDFRRSKTQQNLASLKSLRYTWGKSDFKNLTSNKKKKIKWRISTKKSWKLKPSPSCSIFRHPSQKNSKNFSWI